MLPCSLIYSARSLASGIAFAKSIGVYKSAALASTVKSVPLILGISPADTIVELTSDKNASLDVMLLGANSGVGGVVGAVSFTVSDLIFKSESIGVISTSSGALLVSTPLGSELLFCSAIIFNN